jgi:predicted Zn-dependent peptidase
MQIPAPAPKRTTLDNGLVVVCVPSPSLHSASVFLHIRVGSRFESLQSNGRSHFLEHMLFRGTPTFASAHEQALALERLGGTLYAATHTDFGVMSLSLPPENLQAAVAIFAEIATRPRFTEIEVERAIIREEILESLDDDGNQIDPDNLSRELIFGDHALGFPITGSLQTLDRFGVEELQTHHALHYTASNSVLCFAGAIDPELCVAAAQKLLGTMPTGQTVQASPAPRTQSRTRFKYVENQTSQTDLRVAFRAPGERAAEEPAAEALLRILDDGMSTRLYARICDEKGLCYDVSADYETFEDDGVMDLAAVVQHARAPVVMRELCEVVREMARSGPTDEEMDKMRSRHGWETRALLDDAYALADFHGLATLARVADSPQARHDELMGVTGQQVRDVARRIFRPENLSAVAVGLLDDGERRAVEQAVREFKPIG